VRKSQLDLAFPDPKTDMISTQRSFDYDAALVQTSVNQGVRVQGRTSAVK
jgi:malate synthase